MTEQGDYYWKQVAYSQRELKRIVRPDQKDKFNTQPLPEVQALIRQELATLADENIKGGILDLGGGTNTGYYYSGSDRRLTVLDTAQAAYQTILTSQKEQTLPQGYKVPEQFIEINLNTQQLDHHFLDSPQFAMASLIDVARYIDSESLKRIMKSLQRLLFPGGLFILVDFERLNTPDATEMGEIRRLSGDSNDLIMDELEELGYINVGFILLRDEMSEKFSRFAITGKTHRI